MSFADYCKREKKRVAVIAAVSLLLVPVCLLLTADRADIYLAEGDRVVGIMAEKGTERAELLVTAEKDGISVTKDVILTRKKKGEDSRAEYSVPEDERLRTELNSVLRGLSIPEDNELELPEELPDGTALTWKRRESGRAYLLPLLAGPLLIVYGYRGEKDKEKKAGRAAADSIIRALPEFNNKVVLLLGSGMVFDDALSLIASGSDTEGGSELNRLLASSGAEADALNGDIMAVFASRSGELHIRELSRMVNLIRENRSAGSDLLEKLAAEGEALWLGRKKRAEEKGRAAETKLAIPMSVTLLALVAVTAAPAMMQM